MPMPKFTARGMVSVSGPVEETPKAIKPGREALLTKFKAAFGILLAINVFVSVYIIYKTTNKTKENEHGKVSSIFGIKGKRSHHGNKKQATGSKDLRERSSMDVSSPIRTYVIDGKKDVQISMDDQLKLLKWILEEKRKVKPHNESEKIQIDEEKALLKQITRTKQIPQL